MAEVLLVDRRPHLAVALQRALVRHGHTIEITPSGAEVLDALAERHFDLVIADDRPLEMSAVELVRRLRTWTSVPVILLVTDHAPAGHIAALDAGADDVVAKPLSIDELRARIDAVLRRTRDVVRTPVIAAHGAEIDLRRHELRVRGEITRLTPTQWRVLDALIARRGQLVSHADVIRAVWGRTHGDEARASLRVHVQQLRAKLGDDPRSPRFIATEPRAGYRWLPGAGSDERHAKGPSIA